MKRVIVTGGSGALGRVVAASLARAGARVGITFHTGETAANALCAEHPSISARRLDLTVTADIPRVLDAFVTEMESADAFVHCAGLLSTTGSATYDRLAEVREDGFDRLMAVNVKSAFFAVQHLSSIIKNGNVVLVGSIDGVKAVPSPIPYAIAGGALVSMARALAKDLGRSGIRVNVLAPGVLDGGLSSALPTELRAQYLKHAGLRRVGTREEIANLVTWLALENTYMTGQVIAADGGL